MLLQSQDGCSPRRYASAPAFDLRCRIGLSASGSGGAGGAASGGTAGGGTNAGSDFAFGNVNISAAGSTGNASSGLSPALLILVGLAAWFLFLRKK